MVFDEMELEDGRTGASGRHPRSLPVYLRLHALLHLLLRRERHLTRQIFLQPSNLDGLCEDIVESGELGANKCHILHLWWDYLSVHVEPILLLVKYFD